MAEDLLAEKLEDFGFPITMAFTKDGRIFFSERITGRLWVIKGTESHVITTFPVVPVLGHNETGLLGIALDPDFTDNHYIYCYYTAGTSKRDWKNRVVRIKETDPGEDVILDDIPAGDIHNGGIIAFGPDKTLYVGVGVSNEQKALAQDLSSLSGKVLRINRDGSIPDDNPFPNSPVYSYGHRNIFGIAIHPETGKAYASDVGPDQFDEINIIEKGGNYGWPKEVGPVDDPNTISPLQSYEHVITPTQSCFTEGNAFYFGSFNEGSVHKLTLEGDAFDQVAKDEIVYKGTPWGVVGVFHNPYTDTFYVTTPSAIIPFTPKVI